MLEQRQRETQEQNRMLDQLHASVQNTRDYALRIGGELSEQDKMLDALSTGVASATDESKRQSSSVVQLLKDSKSGGFYITVGILVLIIVVLLAI
jgi:t-SNARE syntaxin family protein